jgi:hypothetical protein
MHMTADGIRLAEARRCEARRRAADIARAEALLRADVAWRRAYSEEFSRIYDQTLAELLAEQKPEAAA